MLLSHSTCGRASQGNVGLPFGLHNRPHAFEVDFAVDRSGFTASRFTRWFDVKCGKPRAEHHWVKVHLMCGVKTNIVTAVEAGEPFSGDSPFFPSMVKTTAQNFTISEVSALKIKSAPDNEITIILLIADC